LPDDGTLSQAIHEAVRACLTASPGHRKREDKKYEEKTTEEKKL